MRKGVYQDFWYVKACWGLVIFEYAAEGSVEHVDVFLGFFTFVFDAVTDFETSGLEIGTVRAGNKFSIGFITWEPSFQIVLLTGSIIKFSRANRNNSVAESKGLHESFGVLNHYFVHLNRFFWFRHHKLFNLLKLMDPKDSPSFSTGCTSFLPKARRKSCKLLWKIFLIQPFPSVVSRNWLF